MQMFSFVIACELTKHVMIGGIKLNMSIGNYMQNLRNQVKQNKWQNDSSKNDQKQISRFVYMC